MQLEFFPSRTMTLYMARLFLVRILAVLVMLVLVLQSLDLLSESGKILDQPGNGQAQLWYYVTLRTPQLIARFLPYSVLLATIITLATLNQNSEVISMKAAGLSAHQVLAPLLLTALLVAGVSFMFNERVVARATATLSAWEAVEFGKVPENPVAKPNVWLRDGDNLLNARAVSGTGNAMVLQEVSWYRRSESGALISLAKAPSAVRTSAGWRLDNASLFDVASARTNRLAEPLIIAKDVTPAQVLIGNIDPDSQSLQALGQTIANMKAAGRRTAELEANWWHKISGPLSTMLMPLLGAVAAFGLARSGALFIRAIIGMSLGFAYFVADNFALAMGNLGAYPPLLAAWSPFVLFAMIGEAVLIRTEE